jgi:hypothetical protein
MLTFATPAINGLRINAMTRPVNTVPNDQKHRTSAFRHWVNEIWMENREERLIYGEEPATIKQYWDRYKYWLKREYRHREKINDR